MNFEMLLLRAKDHEQEAVAEILEMYRPLLIKESIVGGVFDEDIYQELCLTLLRCIDMFRIL